MLTFIFAFSLAYIATALLTSGLGHVVQFRQFRELIHSHGIFPPSLAWPAAVGVVSCEVILASLALMAVIGREPTLLVTAVFVISTGVGWAFLLYVRSLLKISDKVTSCGCLPFPSPLTAASLAPALSLTIVSLLGATATLLSLAAPATFAGHHASYFYSLPCVWGATIAGAVLLLPASMPLPLREEHL